MAVLLSPLFSRKVLFSCSRFLNFAVPNISEPGTGYILLSMSGTIQNPVNLYSRFPKINTKKDDDYDH